MVLIGAVSTKISTKIACKSPINTSCLLRNPFRYFFPARRYPKYPTGTLTPHFPSAILFPESGARRQGETLKHCTDSRLRKTEPAKQSCMSPWHPAGRGREIRARFRTSSLGHDTSGTREAAHGLQDLWKPRDDGLCPSQTLHQVLAVPNHRA